jgi:lysophosphatidic acid acyltransferase/lysophosphatidylinositol acyltransferase
MEVARQKGLPELKHHLLPRTKGFVHSVHGLKGKGMACCCILWKRDNA